MTPKIGSCNTNNSLNVFTIGFEQLPYIIIVDAMILLNQHLDMSPDLKHSVSGGWALDDFCKMHKVPTKQENSYKEMNDAFISNCTDITQYCVYGMFDVEVLYNLCTKLDLFVSKQATAVMNNCSLIQVYGEWNAQLLL